MTTRSYACAPTAIVWILRQGDWTEPRPGDEVVMLDGVGITYDATRAIAYRINQPLWQAGYQTPDRAARLVAEGNQSLVCRSTARRGESCSSMRPRFDVPVVNVDVTGHGDHIFAVAVAQSDKDFFVPGAWVSSDGGESWLDVKGLDTGMRIRAASRWTATATPTSVRDGGYRSIDSEGNALPIPVVGVDRTPFASGDGVCMLGSDDHGPRCAATTNRIGPVGHPWFREWKLRPQRGLEVQPRAGEDHQQSRDGQRDARERRRAIAVPRRDHDATRRPGRWRC